MNHPLPPWIYRLAAIAVYVWAAPVSSGGAVSLLPSVLLVLALAWADAAGGGGEQDGATWSGTLKRLLGPTVLPFYLCIAAAVVFAGSSHRNGDPGCGAMACGVCGTVGAPVPASAPASASVAAAAPSMCGGSKGGCGASGGGACGCGSGSKKTQSGSACGCGSGASKSKKDGAGAGSPSAPDRLEGRPPKEGAPSAAAPQTSAPPAQPVPVPPVLKGRTMQALPARSLPGISPTARPLPPGLKPNPSAPLPPGVKPLPATVPAAPSADESGDSNEESRKAGSGS
jgi:hypothetical protein